MEIFIIYGILGFMAFSYITRFWLPMIRKNKATGKDAVQQLKEDFEKNHGSRR